MSASALGEARADVPAAALVAPAVGAERVAVVAPADRASVSLVRAALVPSAPKGVAVVAVLAAAVLVAAARAAAVPGAVVPAAVVLAAVPAAAVLAAVAPAAAVREVHVPRGARPFRRAARSGTPRAGRSASPRRIELEGALNRRRGREQVDRADPANARRRRPTAFPTGLLLARVKCRLCWATVTTP